MLRRTRKFVAAPGIDTLAEISRSGDGAHVWMFFDASVPRASARTRIGDVASGDGGPRC